MYRFLKGTGVITACLALMIPIFGMMSLPTPQKPATPQYVLGFADSGAGGLIFAVDAYRELLPFLQSISSKYNVEFVFDHIGDTKNAPYGQKSPEQIASLTKNFVGYMVNDASANVAVIACNTASTVVDESMATYFSQTYSGIPIMPIIVKSAETLYKRAKVVETADGRREITIGVLATPATVASGQYKKALEKIHSERFGKDGVVMNVYFYGPKQWVYNIEHGASKEANQAEIAGDLNSFLSVKGAEKVSAIGLFCTHFPFFKNEIANYFSARGIKDVVFVSQGKIFAAKIRSKIEADIDSGKIKKRAVALNIKSVPHPVVRSHITGDNLLEIKGVLSKIAPDMVDSVVFDKVTITPVAI